MNPSELRSIRWLLFGYCIFILYGSFIPFHFNADMGFIRLQFSIFFSAPYQQGVRNFSIPDVVSNILLFVPFGVLWAGSRVRGLLDDSISLACLAAGAIGLIFGLGIELGQVFSPGRTPSLMDAFCNGLGSAIGGAGAHVLFRALRGRLGSIVLQLIRERPSIILLAFVALVPIADAFYPFQITLDVSTAWGNLKRTQWIPFAGGLHRFWADLLVEKIFVFAVIGYLAFRNLTQKKPARRILAAWVVSSFFSLIVEAGKLLFVGRVPNIENVILSSAGALFGVLIVPSIAEIRIFQERSVESLLVLWVVLIAYSELTPFDWVQSVSEIHSRIAKIEWLPLADYYGADPPAAIFDLGKKLFLAGSFGFLLSGWNGGGAFNRRRRIAATAGLALGSLLEGCQIFLRSRTPSVTDVIIFGLALWIGAAVFNRFRRMTSSVEFFNWTR